MKLEQKSKKRQWKRKEKPTILYSVPLPFGLVLNAKQSANAWWVDQQRVDKLITAFKIGSTIPEACSYAQITLRQYKYFVKMHPEFVEARRGLIITPDMLAKMTIIRAINKGDVKTARWWLKRKTPEEFGTPSQIAAANKKHIIEEQKMQRLENIQISDEEKEHLEKLRIARRKRIEQQAKVKN